MENKNRIVVTGLGVINGLGNNASEFFKNAMDGKSGITPCTLFDASKLKTEYVGEIKQEIPYVTESPGQMERIHYIMESAISEMLYDSKLTPDDIQSMGDRVFLSFATSLASNGRIISYIKDENKDTKQPDWLVQIPGFVPWIKERCKIKGGCYTTMSACAAGSTSAGIAYDLMREGKADIVIVGGADPLTEFSCVGFHALKALSNSICKPFDKDRDGINIGEAGAFFVFETLDHALARNARIYGEVLGYGINNDAYHITSPDPEGKGAYASMCMAVEESGIRHEDIGLINAHGTGTILNDKMETKAIDRFLNGQGENTYVFSNKGMVGHCLAAAGAVELAATLLCIWNNQVMPSVNLVEPMEEFRTGKLKDERVSYALSNSFAFAGNTASILVGAFHDE